MTDQRRANAIAEVAAILFGAVDNETYERVMAAIAYTTRPEVPYFTDETGTQWTRLVCPACGDYQPHPWWTVGDDSYACDLVDVDKPRGWHDEGTRASNEAEAAKDGREGIVDVLRHDIESLLETAVEMVLARADRGGRSFDHWEGQAQAYTEVLARINALSEHP